MQSTSKITRPDYWSEATAHLSNVDAVLKKIISSYRKESLVGYNRPFETLIRAITGQQISVQAAEAVWQRLSGALVEISPKAVLMHDPFALKALGLSRQKIDYIKNVALFFEQESAHLSSIWRDDDESVIQRLIKIRGVGRWTAEMFLIFGLLRSDVMPLADIGLQKAIKRFYPHLSLLKKEDYIQLSNGWRPYRSVATWYFWRSLDPIPVQY